MTSADFTKSILPADAQPVAVTLLYKTATGYLVISEAAGLFSASPASPTTESWATVGAAYERSAKVIADHLTRRMPDSTPPIDVKQLPDFSPEAGEPT
jgi:hypothetical protein